MSKLVKLALAQFAMSNSASENRKKAAEMISRSAREGANIVCLPELFTSPYFCNQENAGFDYAEPLEGETYKVLSKAAEENKIIIVGGSFHEKVFEEGKDKFYNTALVFNEKGESLGFYRKTHIPHDPAFYEQNYFLPGDTGFRIFETSVARIAVLICYDQWFPEAARALALAGVDIVFYPTAIGTLSDVEQVEGNWQEAWENVQRGHAIANCMIVSAVNRVGVEGKSCFWGGSFVCNAFGKTLKRAGNSEELLIQEVDLDHSKFVRESWRFFYNRRPETYRALVNND